MKVSVEFLSRIFGAILLSILAGMLGNEIAILLRSSQETNAVIFGLLGALTGLVLTPHLTVYPLRRLRFRLTSLPPETLVAILVGTFLGLAATALISRPLSLLPHVFSQLVPLFVSIVLIYLSIAIVVARQHDLWAFFNDFRPMFMADPNLSPESKDDFRNVILLDTSVIIDGRITDISKTGFFRATLLVPNFVLQELQHVADSADAIRRNRGRRGLEVLSILQEDVPIPVRITDMDVSEVRDVDSKLVALARHLQCPIMTNDYNLNRVAELQGVTVLNINDLANAVKVAYLPGEDLSLKIIQEGREFGQGVGYLEDGTMVVVEEGSTLIDQHVDLIVTKTLQTSAGRMIFARLNST
jgi:uncharacterized protein YacL